MRWFLAWLITALLTALAHGLYWLAGADIPVVSSLLRRLQPPLVDVAGGLGGPWLIFWSQVACWAVTRLVLIRLFAYINSETEGSPRGPELGASAGRSRANRRRIALGALAVRLFHNPTGRWLALYAVLLNLAVWAAAPLVLRPSMEASLVHPAYWGLSALYAMTVAAAAATPDKLIPLRPQATDPNPDPVLDLPGNADATAGPALGAP